MFHQHFWCIIIIVVCLILVCSCELKKLHLIGNTGRLKSAGVLKQLLIEEGIIPELIDDAPRHGVTVMYKDRSLAFGNKLQVFDIVSKPKTVNWPLKKGELYTLILTGLDMPSRENPDEREYLHWLVVNIPDRNIREGVHAPPYAGAPYQYQTGIHRIVYLIYKQNDIIENMDGVHHETEKVVRSNFSTRLFTKRHNLSSPLAINFGEIDDECDLHNPPEL